MEKGVEANLNQVFKLELSLSDLITHLKSSKDSFLRQYLQDMVDKCFDENFPSFWSHKKTLKAYVRDGPDTLLEEKRRYSCITMQYHMSY